MSAASQTLGLLEYSLGLEMEVQRLPVDGREQLVSQLEADEGSDE